MSDPTPSPGILVEGVSLASVWLYCWVAEQQDATFELDVQYPVSNQDLLQALLTIVMNDAALCHGLLGQAQFLERKGRARNRTSGNLQEE